MRNNYLMSILLGEASPRVEYPSEFKPLILGDGLIGHAGIVAKTNESGLRRRRTWKRDALGGEEYSRERRVENYYSEVR